MRQTIRCTGMAIARATTCGVLVTDPAGRLLIGQATHSPRWDIPKGVAEPGEPWDAAAIRELREETGLEADPADLQPRGHHRYLPAKDLALFAWRPTAPIDPATLRCTAVVQLPNGRSFPELARFALLPWNAALDKLGKNMARVLHELGP